MNPNEFEDIEKNSKYEVIKLADDNKDDDRKTKIINNLSDEVDRLFTSAKKVASETKDNEKIQDAYERAKLEANRLIEKGKVAVNNLKDDDKVQDVWTSISEGFDRVVKDLSKNETVVKVGNKVDEFVSSQSVQDGVKTVKEGSRKVVDKAYSGLKNLLKDKENGES